MSGWSGNSGLSAVQESRCPWWRRDARRPTREELMLTPCCVCRRDREMLDEGDVREAGQVRQRQTETYNKATERHVISLPFLHQGRERGGGEGVK